MWSLQTPTIKFSACPWKISNRPVAASPSGWTLRSWQSRLTWRLPLWRAHPLDKDRKLYKSIWQERVLPENSIVSHIIQNSEIKCSLLGSPCWSLPVGVSDCLTTNSQNNNQNLCAEFVIPRVIITKTAKMIHLITGDFHSI